MPEPDTSIAGSCTCSRENRIWSGSQPSAHRARLLCRHRVLGVPRLGMGALCHPMLPAFTRPNMPQIVEPAAGRRYVDYAIRDLARQFDALGARRGEVEVKLFGGGDVLDMANPAKRPTVGKLNCEVAIRRCLRRKAFTSRRLSLGGTSGSQYSLQHGDRRSAAASG
jgi:chemotaxis receptor (MCP) glutamine deamidase CheD